jgi:hypothetical protein
MATDLSNPRGATYQRFSPDHSPYVMRHTWASWHHAIHKDLVLLEQEGAWEGPATLRVYAHLMSDVYRQEAIDILGGQVDFRFGEEAIDLRIGAIAVQRKRT